MDVCSLSRAGGHPRTPQVSESKKVSESRVGRGAALTHELHTDPILCNGSAMDSSGHGALMGMRYHTIDP